VDKAVDKFYQQEGEGKTKNINKKTKL